MGPRARAGRQRLWCKLANHDEEKRGKHGKPLRKNWLPSLVKNLEPLVEMVGMAETRLINKPNRMESSMFGVAVGVMAKGNARGSTSGRTAEKQY